MGKIAFLGLGAMGSRMAILETEIQTAARVAKLVFDSGLARGKPPTDMLAFIRQHVYKPEYKEEAASTGA